ncbi:hypothetical protein [Streptomyces sp. NPDC058374]|uniref:hypothetical protein n=1 Tax=Streptomyces sp. NPDC058374 TaxID=3346466 RepID=UPI0036534B78
MSRGAAPFTGVALALAMVVALAPAAVAAGGAPAAAAADDTLTVDNATGLASDGKPMAGPGLDNTDVDGYYYSIGATQLDASAGGTSLALYRGKDWRNKSLLKVVADADTTYTMPDGTVTHPLANAKLERIDFERAPSGKYVVWVHWELKATYSASQTMALVADKPTGPYEVVATHARPGASLNVGGKGQAGSTDFKDAMGDRVGQLRKDYDTGGKSGAYDGSAEAPTTGSDYPPQISTFSQAHRSSRQWLRPGQARAQQRRPVRLLRTGGHLVDLQLQRPARRHDAQGQRRAHDAVRPVGLRGRQGRRDQPEPGLLHRALPRGEIRPHEGGRYRGEGVRRRRRRGVRPEPGRRHHADRGRDGPLGSRQ